MLEWPRELPAGTYRHGREIGMFRTVVINSGVILFMVVAVAARFEEAGEAPARQQTWTGTISDNMCGAAHEVRAKAGNLTDRQCVIQCIKELGRYVLAGERSSVIPIENQDFPGLPFFAGRTVKITGELQQGSIVISAIEAAGPD